MISLLAWPWKPTKGRSHMTDGRAFFRSALFKIPVLAFLFAAVGTGATAQDYTAIVAAPDRSDADRQNDLRRDPVQMLAFSGVKTGMKVLDMEAGAGYSTELLARAVGPGGLVYAQDSTAAIERFVKDKVDIRAQSPAMKNVRHGIRDFPDPMPPAGKALDLDTFL